MSDNTEINSVILIKKTILILQFLFSRTSMLTSEKGMQSREMFAPGILGSFGTTVQMPSKKKIKLKKPIPNSVFYYSKQKYSETTVSYFKPLLFGTQVYLMPSFKDISDVNYSKPSNSLQYHLLASLSWQLQALLHRADFLYSVEDTASSGSLDLCSHSDGPDSL